MRLQPGRLRDKAEMIESATGLRVEIVGGALVMSPTPRGKHYGVILRLRKALDPRLPEDLELGEVISVPMPDDPDDYVTPDLVVIHSGFANSDEWLVEPAEIELAVEVISKSEKAKDITGKIEWYAQVGLRLLLVVDPRHSSWTMRFHPRDGAYQGVLQGQYGELIPLPSPFGLSLDTSDFPAY
jgi:Uma2 family endonuclease